MKIYCLINDKDKPSSPLSMRLFSKAVEESGSELSYLESDKVDFSNLPVIDDGAAVYRISTNYASSVMEKLLINDTHKTFYLDDGQYIREGTNNLVHFAKEGVKTPETIFGIAAADDEKLANYVDSLGGFPIILKRPGGNHGVNVDKYDNFADLRAAIDKHSQSSDAMFLKRFIDFRQRGRLIVLGDRVIAAAEYARPQGGYKTELGTSPTVTPQNFSDEINSSAVAAAQATGVSFAGVDILVDEQGEHYVLEANFPCNFSRLQEATGIDIASMMVDYLLKP